MATRGRRKRTRKAGARSGVKVKGHGRSPRGSNSGKPKVRVDGYSRGKPRRKGRGSRKRKR